MTLKHSSLVRWVGSLMLVLGFLLSQEAQALTVEEAYQAIPHRRTVFQASQTSMPAADSAYLTQLFEAVDRAIVARVEAARGTEVGAAYQLVWVAWKKLKAPAKLQKTQDLLREAIENEQASLAASHGRLNSSDPRAQAASQKLHQAYDQIMTMYPAENPTVKAAFFDYPCALDFF